MSSGLKGETAPYSSSRHLPSCYLTRLARSVERLTPCCPQALSNYKEDHATLSDEMTAVLNYLDKLKPQCETKVMSPGERAKWW